MITLVIGGRRSGKSAWAEALALEKPGNRLVYVATCPASDQSMRERIKTHQERRAAQGRNWELIEEPLELAPTLALEDSQMKNGLFFIDCITLWISNMMQTMGDTAVRTAICSLCATAGQLENNAIIISNETGLGIAPATDLGNRFIDFAGLANQELARVAHEVVFITAGLPLYLKRAERLEGN